MSNEVDELAVPTHARAGTAFMGTELKDAFILIIAVFLSLPAGKIFGTLGYLALPLGGFYINRIYLEYKRNTLPGQFTAWLYQTGICESLPFLAYGNFKGANTEIHGDAKAINPEGFTNQVMKD